MAQRWMSPVSLDRNWDFVQSQEDNGWKLPCESVCSGLPVENWCFPGCPHSSIMCLVEV